VISVVIPTLNEAACLGATLEAVFSTAPASEVIVVDGGSDDATPAIAMAAGARVLLSPERGRAAQLNHGAAAAHGDVLLFLHADTILPVGWAAAVEGALAADAKCVGGAFRRRYVPGSRFLRATCALATWRGRWAGWFLGDQAMFVRRLVFVELGGFARLSACEDLDLSLRLARRGQTALLGEFVLTSDRRFRRRGAWRQTGADIATTWRYLRERGTGANG